MNAQLSVPATGEHDFDFLFGHWQVRNERLRRRLADCHDWDHFDARVECRPVLGGMGNREHFDSDWQGGYHGLALRLFDRETGQWRIWWASDRSGQLETPVIGRFDREVGTFYGPEMHGDVPVLSRYRWTRIDARQATWDQAWSRDRGEHWETNWIMHFSRVGD